MLHSVHITPVIHIDQSGESFLLIGGAILLGGLIGGLVGVITATDDENLLGSFTGGFVNGAINTAGLAAALATGGSSAFAIAALTGLAGGVFGSITNQSISYGNVNYGLAFANGLVSATANVMALYGARTLGDTLGTTWGERFVESIVPSLSGYAISTTINLVVLPNVNRFSSVASTSLINPSQHTLKIDFSWR